MRDRAVCRFFAGQGVHHKDEPTASRYPCVASLKPMFRGFIRRARQPSSGHMRQGRGSTNEVRTPYIAEMLMLTASKGGLEKATVSANTDYLRPAVPLCYATKGSLKKQFTVDPIDRVCLRRVRGGRRQ